MAKNYTRVNIFCCRSTLLGFFCGEKILARGHTAGQHFVAKKDTRVNIFCCRSTLLGLFCGAKNFGEGSYSWSTFCDAENTPGSTFLTACQHFCGFLRCEQFWRVKNFGSFQERSKGHFEKDLCPQKPKKNFAARYARRKIQ